jgi:phosphate butyryltransferase
MINDFAGIYQLAKEKGPGKLVVLAPEDREFMNAVKIARHEGYVEPIFIGNLEKMQIAAEGLDFNIDQIKKVFLNDPQEIADYGIAMLFKKETDLVSKGQIPTSYIYRAVIKEEQKRGIKNNISVTSLLEIPGCDHIVAVTDVGVNITPDYEAKAEIIKDAVSLMNLLGYDFPQVVVLSANRGYGPTLQSYLDAQRLREEYGDGNGGFEIRPEHSVAELFDSVKVSPPHVFLAPELDTGNIMAKLNYVIPVKRCATLLCSAGPVAIPSRSDFTESIVRDMALGAVLAARIKEKNIGLKI